MVLNMFNRQLIECRTLQASCWPMRRVVSTIPETKAIIFSGYAIDGPVQEILDAGADGLIQKPFSFSTLSSQ
jgi:DNA-binding NarL/FixJ family response regulator